MSGCFSFSLLHHAKVTVTDELCYFVVILIIANDDSVLNLEHYIKIVDSQKNTDSKRELHCQFL